MSALVKNFLGVEPDENQLVLAILNGEEDVWTPRLKPDLRAQMLAEERRCQYFTELGEQGIAREDIDPRPWAKAMEWGCEGSA